MGYFRQYLSGFPSPRNLLDLCLLELMSSVCLLHCRQILYPLSHWRKSKCSIGTLQKKKNQKLIYQEKTEKFPWMWVLMSWKIKAVYKLFFQSNMIKFLWVFLSPTLYGTMSNKGQYGLARKEWVHKWVWLQLAPHIKQVICPLKFDVRGYQTKWFLTISKLLYKVHGSVVLNHADYLPRKSAIS